MIYWKQEEGVYRNGLNIRWRKGYAAIRSLEIVLYLSGVGRIYWRWRQGIAPHFIYDWSRITRPYQP